jgi:hypothetical protein
MVTRGEARPSQFSSAAATLLVAYLLVLQGLALGVTSGRNTGGLAANAICFNKASTPIGDNQSPARPARHGDICCVFHVALGGATGVSPFIGELPATGYRLVNRGFDSTDVRRNAATPPLGSRAPPSFMI